MSDTPEWSSPDARPERETPPPAPPPQQYYGQYQPPRQAFKPGIIPLRPLGVGEILDGAITTMRRYPKAVLGVSAIVVAVTQLLSLVIIWPMIDDLNRFAAIDPNTATPQQQQDMALDVLSSGLISGTVGLVVTLIGQVFLSGYITVIVGRAVLGQPITFGEAWAEFRPRLLRLLGATILYGLIIAAGVLLAVVLGVFASFFLSFLVIPLIVWLAVMFSLVTPALVLERGTVGESFGRSRLLVDGVWWRTFGILLLAAFLASVIGNIIGIPFNLGTLDINALLEGRPQVMTFGALLLATIGGAIAGTITQPFRAAVTVLLYVDRRMRREGMDIELARAAGGQV
ncbi:hypothetical protein [Lentzea sp. NBRC 105346]|uniref:hypothetical protein n=1 Tax=Lentzea sp. NBRC 105346 TaxID=3032205 RepID=UPI002553742B|nr:hypothetical protein [Lentzea sp. NBRC 105346]